MRARSRAHRVAPRWSSGLRRARAWTRPETDHPASPTVRLILVLALLAALIAGAALAGRFLLQRNLVVVVPTASSVPAPSAGSSSAPALPNGRVLAGRYSVASDVGRTPYAISVPGGWTYSGGSLFKGDFRAGNGVAVRMWAVLAVYADACRWQDTSRAVGSGEVAAALAQQKGLVTSGPTDATVAGFARSKSRSRFRVTST